MTIQKKAPLLLVASLVGFASLTAHADSGNSRLRDLFDDSARHSPIIDFPQRVGAAGDPVNGRSTFGFAVGSNDIDRTNALFDGVSTVSGQPVTVTGNGKVCATCHLAQFQYGLPPGNLSHLFPPGDPFFDMPEAGADPLGPQLLFERGLIATRAGRFNPFLAPDDPFRQVFSWRKTQHLLNVVFTHGLLNDGRARELIEQARGAVFTHTQNSDERFDDITNGADLSSKRLKDMAAWEETLIDPPELKALLDPTDPNYQNLVNNPFATVSLTTAQQRRGQQVFQYNCMGCHNEPNVFSNRDHQNNAPLVTPPNFGHVMDIGVAQRNKFQLEVRRYDPVTQQRHTIVLGLVRQDGSVAQYPVRDDIGAAADTGRFEDLHRFKIPQLRRITQMAPYFHDNSAASLEDVVDYFNSDDYNDSADGSRFPIHLSHSERSDLIEFLKAL
jgi:cytochrome c peroxidase